MALKLRRGADVPALQAGEPYFDGDKLHVGKLDGSGNKEIGSEKQDAETGKGLSTEDYTTAEKAKLATVDEGANNYTHPASHSMSIMNETTDRKIMTAAERAKLAAMTEHDKGYFANEAAIIAAHPTGSAGWFCRNGETDTVWVWDVEGEAWVDTGNTGGSIPLLYEITMAQLGDAVLTETLVTGAYYRITDYSNEDVWIMFPAISTTELSITGTRLMIIPDVPTYNWMSDDYSVDDLVQWGGKVWKNLTGETAEPVSILELDSTNWVLIPKTSYSNEEYAERLFSIKMDWGHMWIFEQTDERGNVLGADYSFNSEYDIVNFQSQGLEHGSFNPVDVSDWEKLGKNNKCMGIINIIMPAGCDYNTLDGIIANVISANNGMLRSNHMIGNIIDVVVFNDVRYNSCKSIVNAIVEGTIENNNNTGVIGDVMVSNGASIKNNLPTTGNITGSFNADVEDTITDKTGT